VSTAVSRPRKGTERTLAKKYFRRLSKRTGRPEAPRSERSSVHSLTRMKVRPRVKPKEIAYLKVKPRETPWRKGSLSLRS
jgi:hypothetical protein